ncbi:MAG: globin [Sphingobium sp.]|nr:globin [Sphingobium sp.]MCP5398630.1 globin [Sphingomonas sp.]
MSQPATPYQMIGGKDAVAAIVGRFYDLMDSEPGYADLRALHARDLSTVRHGLTLFLNAWLGGPKDWFERGSCVMSLHRRFPIPPSVADQWSDAMARAIAAQPGIDKELGLAMAERLGHMARAMVNRTEDDAAQAEAA